MLSLISSLGTVAITANAVANSILTFQTLTEDAMGIAMITVIGQCAGAGEQEQARGYTKRLMRDTYLMMWAVNIPIALCGSLVLLFRAVAFAWKAFKGKRKPAQIVSG